METPQKKLVIAIVDDHEAIREALESLLKSTGYAAKTFPSAEDYLRDHPHDEADCLILDVNLPGMSGLDLQQALAAGNRSPVPIVFITSHDDSGGHMRAQALRSGAVAFLSKPFDDDALLDAVRDACGRSQ